MTAGTMGDAHFETIRAQLLRLVRSRCPRWLADQAEDIVQSALARALDAGRRQGKDASEEPSVAYLMTTAQHALIDEIRRKFRQVEVPLENDQGEAPGAIASGADQEQALHARAIEAGLRDCLQQLAPSRRQVVALHLLGHVTGEIVERLAQSRKSVEHLTYRGLADLRDCLDAKGLRP